MWSRMIERWWLKDCSLRFWHLVFHIIQVQLKETPDLVFHTFAVFLYSLLAYLKNYNPLTNPISLPFHLLDVGFWTWLLKSTMPEYWSSWRWGLGLEICLRMKLCKPLFWQLTICRLFLTWLRWLKWVIPKDEEKIFAYWKMTQLLCWSYQNDCLLFTDVPDHAFL